eukprot:963564-Pleurochrysis_carterae.AAC.1
MDELSSVVCKAAKKNQDERGNHVPAPQRVMLFRLLECGVKPTTEESRRGSVFAKANVAPRVGGGRDHWGWG